MITSVDGTFEAQETGTTTGETQVDGTTTVAGTKTNDEAGIVTIKELGTVTIKFDGTVLGTLL